MGRRAGERVDGTKLDAACRLLNVGVPNVPVEGAERLGEPEVMAVGAKTLQRYREAGAVVQDVTLAKVCRNVLGLADVWGHGLQVWRWLGEMVGPAGPRLPTCADELTRWAAHRRAGVDLGRVPAVAAELFEQGYEQSRGGTAAEAERLFLAAGAAGESPVDVLLARGNHWQHRGEVDRAADLFDAALDLRPDDVHLALCAARAHLAAREDVAHGQWDRAARLVERHAGAAGLTTPAGRHWLLLRAVVRLRDPQRSGDPTNFAERAAELGDLVRAMDGLDDRVTAANAWSLYAVALYRTSANVGRAVDALKADVKTLNSAALDAPRGVALKQMANFLLYLPAEGEDRRDHLRNAIRCYESSCDCFAERGNDAEWALSKYSQAAAHMELGVTYVGGDGEATARDMATAQRCFVAAEAACLAALEKLPFATMPVDWGRATFNLAECHHRWPGRSPAGQVAGLGRAVECYTAALRAFPRTYDPGEWAGTHKPLADAYADVAAATGEDGESLAQAIASMKAAATVLPLAAELDRLRGRYDRCPSAARRPFDEIEPAG